MEGTFDYSEATDAVRRSARLFASGIFGKLIHSKERSMQNDLERTVSSEMSAYYRSIAQRLHDWVEPLSNREMWQKPYPYGNSIGHLVLHLTGNLNHYIGALVAGTGYVRHREQEFSDPARYPVEEILANFHRAVDLVVSTLESQDESGFATSVADQPPIQTRLGLFLVCAAHLNNHIGQMSYLVQAQGHSTQEPPVW